MLEGLGLGGEGSVSWVQGAAAGTAVCGLLLVAVSVELLVKESGPIWVYERHCVRAGLSRLWWRPVAVLRCSGD